MGASYYVKYVVTYNREDCCQGRLNNYYVYVGDNSNYKKNAICGFKNKYQRGQTIQCDLIG